jgi:hypothetical protein
VSVTVLITGYKQPARISNGMRKIRNGILAKQPDADVRVYSYKQFEDKSFAYHLATELAATGDPIVGAAHSWGSWAWCKLADVLPFQSVANLFLADPVSRPPGGTLEIPGAVCRLHTWRKKSGLIPTAVLSLDEGVEHETDAVVDVSHPKVDDDANFIAAVVYAATT